MAAIIGNAVPPQRQRVIDAMHLREPDRVPVGLWGTSEGYQNLRKGLDMPGPVAAMAALELARLQATGAEADLTRAEARLADTVPGLLVSHAHDLLDQGQSSP